MVTAMTEKTSFIYYDLLNTLTTRPNCAIRSTAPKVFYRWLLNFYNIMMNHNVNK